MSIDVTELTIKKAQKMLKAGDITARDLADAYVAQVKKKNKDINAYVEVFEDVDKQAKEADQLIKAGKDKELTGIPMGIKDLILINDRLCSAGSNMLKNYRASYDATVIRKLKEQGVVFLGRTNTDEFAMGASTETSAYGPTKNPHDTTRVPGGSSGGSAAAVAMDGCLGALGSDTGGSIRQPASFCGVVGLKPTYGAVSRHGVMAMASSLDQIGPFAKTIDDTEMIFNAIKGFDRLDSTSAPDKYHIEHRNTKPKTIGIPQKFFEKGVEKEVLERFEEGVTALKDAGYKVVDVDLPHIKYSLSVYYILMPAEASTNLARYDGMRYGLSEAAPNLLDTYKKTRAKGFGEEVRRRILLGTYVLSAGYYDAYYNRANAIRNLIRKDFEKVFKKVDALVTPTAPTVSFKLGEKTADPLQMYLADVFTVPANLAGVPGISVPYGTAHGLPVGFQVTAPHYGESTLFNIGRDLEKRRIT